jgi:hypothetical protein
VHRRNPLQLLGAGQWGKLVGNDHIVLNFDTDKGRHDARNQAACPGSWKATHNCPETNQPDTVPGGSSYGHGSYAPARYVQQGVNLGDAGYNTIADELGGNSGLIWTCDEWPPAMQARSPPLCTRTLC